MRLAEISSKDIREFMPKINERLFEAVVKQITERYNFHPEDDAQLIEFRELIRATIELYTNPIHISENEEIQ